MIDKSFIDEFEARQTAAMAKLEAYPKVLASIKRLHESNERKRKEAKVALERAGGIEVASPRHQQKVLELQAASAAYTDACILVAESAKEFKDTMLREVREFKKMMDEP